MKRLILILIFAFVSANAFGQVLKSSGILYFETYAQLATWGEPVDAYGSEIAKVTSEGIFYEWHDLVGAWIEWNRTRSTYNDVAQAGHDFALLQPVSHFGGVFVAGTISDEPIGIVSKIYDANNFEITYNGEVEATGHGLTIDQIYYTPTAAGSAVLIDATGNIKQPIFRVLDANLLTIDIHGSIDDNNLPIEATLAEMQAGTATLPKVVTPFSFGTISQMEAAKLQTSFGQGAGELWTGLNGLTSFGVFAGNASSGNKATYVGVLAGSTSSGDNTTFVGYNSGANSSESNGSLAIGYEAGQFTSGVDLTAIGRRSGWNNFGDNVTAIGVLSCNINVADNVTAIGYNSAGSNTYSNITVIGSGATASQIGHIVLAANGVETKLTAGTYNFNIDQNLTASEDGYILAYDNATSEFRAIVNTGGAGATVADSDYGDIVVSGTGTNWQIDAGVITTAEINVSALVTEAEGLASSDNDTSFPTTAAVIDYISNNAQNIGNSNLAIPISTNRTLSVPTTGDFKYIETGNVGNFLQVKIDGAGAGVSLAIENGTQAKSGEIFADTKFNVLTSNADLNLISENNQVLITSGSGSYVNTGRNFSFVNNLTSQGYMTLTDNDQTRVVPIRMRGITNSNHVGISASSSTQMNSSYIIELPEVQPTAGQILEIVSLSGGKAVTDWVNASVPTVDTHIGNSNLALPAATDRELKLTPTSDFYLSDSNNTNNRIIFHLDGTGADDDLNYIRFEHATAGNVTSDLYTNSAGQFNIISEESISIDATGLLTLEGNDILIQDGDAGADGVLTLNDNNSAQKMGLRWEDNTGSEYFQLQAPDALTNTQIANWPTKIATTGQILTASTVVGPEITLTWETPTTSISGYWQGDKTTSPTTNSFTAGVWQALTAGYLLNEESSFGPFSYNPTTGGVTYTGDQNFLRVHMQIDWHGTASGEGFGMGIGVSGAISASHQTESFSLPSGQFTTLSITKIIEVVNGDIIYMRLKPAFTGDKTFKNIQFSIEER